MAAVMWVFFAVTGVEGGLQLKVMWITSQDIAMEVNNLITNLNAMKKQPLIVDGGFV